MAEELKQGENKCCCGGGKALSTIFKVVLGLALLALGCWSLLRWWKLSIMIGKGCIGLFLILAGIITLAIAKE